jgi:hypothetical protein
MISKYLFLFLLTVLTFIGCEKEEDPRYRIKNDLDFDNYFQVRQYQGTTSFVLLDSINVETETPTEYRNIGVGSYMVSTIDSPIVSVGFSPEINKKYTIEFYKDNLNRDVGRVVEP